MSKELFCGGLFYGWSLSYTRGEGELTFISLAWGTPKVSFCLVVIVGGFPVSQVVESVVNLNKVCAVVQFI